MSTKEDIINYVMTTPHNTNRSVLTSLLDGLETENSGGDGGTEIMRVKLMATNGGGLLSPDGVTTFDILDAINEGKRVEIHYYEQKGPNGGIDMILLPDHYNWELSNDGNYVFNGCTFHGMISSEYNGTLTEEHRTIVMDSDGTTYTTSYRAQRSVTNVYIDLLDSDFSASTT